MNLEAHEAIHPDCVHVDRARSTFGELELLAHPLGIDSISEGVVDDGRDRSGSQACERIVCRLELQVRAVEVFVHAVFRESGVLICAAAVEFDGWLPRNGAEESGGGVWKGRRIPSTICAFWHRSIGKKAGAPSRHESIEKAGTRSQLAWPFAPAIPERTDFSMFYATCIAAFEFKYD